MYQVAIDAGVVIACIAIEVFLISIGWNLAVKSLFAMPGITLAESFGLMLLLKTIGIQLFPTRRRNETT